MKAHECHHCKQWIEEGEAHDCWTTTESALTEDLSEDLREAWERLRETAVAFGDQRIYASGRQSCSRGSHVTFSCARGEATCKCACSSAAPSARRRFAGWSASPPRRS